ncbi:hypothetical protein HGA64_02015 [Candidatus Falkowbacteria bacterium]|nr:hypothetical protein [Candidatus Falkowbacteria bacterium]
MDETTSEIYELVKTKVEEQGAYDLDAFQEIVNETIDFFLERGKLSDEDNIEFIKDELLTMRELLQDEAAHDE